MKHHASNGLGLTPQARDGRMTHMSDQKKGNEPRKKALFTKREREAAMKAKLVCQRDASYRWARSRTFT